MYRMTVTYHHPADPEEFLRHYREVHAPLAAKLPGLRAYEWAVAESPDGSRPRHFMVATLDWDTKEEALAAFASPEGEAGTADMANFTTPDGFEMVLGEVTKTV
ncbi:EthD family reductase [Prauserella sp. PE36]|nr:EthD family reductase [Prauserella sp. PE36]